jgi:outer membrane protein assembly factor BamB
VSNGKVFIISLTPPTIAALRSKDGSAIWQQQPQALPPTSLVIQDEVLYAVRSIQGPIIALQASDGTPLRDYQGKDVDGAAPSISLMTDHERVYISSLFVNNGFFGSSLEVRKATDGTVVWNYPYQKVASIFKLVDDIVYVGASAGFYQGDRQSGSVCALQASIGTKLWCHQANTGVAPITIG